MYVKLKALPVNRQKLTLCLTIKEVIIVIRLCEDCGCPAFGASSWHFKNCPTTLAAKNRTRWWKWIDKKRVVDLMKRELEDIESDIDSVRRSIERLEKVMTDSCLDEVYLCIYDCIRTQVVPAF